MVTVNCARLGFLFKDDEEGLLRRLDYLLELAKTSLEIKRKVIQRHIDQGLFPYTKRYLGTLRNHFSTIGVNGINEMIRNFTSDREDITTDWGHAFALRLLDHVRARLVEFQEETDHMYNLEATPAEGTTYRFAKEDRKRFPGILQAGTPRIRTTRTPRSCPSTSRTTRSRRSSVRTTCNASTRAARCSTST